MYMSSIRCRFLICSLILLLGWSTSALAAANVTVTPAGDKAYSVQGAGMDGTAGIQLDIRYDAASLSTPTVTQGGAVSGAMFAANTTQPGFIKIAIVSTNTFSANGQIATITFAARSGSGGISSVIGSMIDKTGAPFQSTYAYSNIANEPDLTSPTSRTGQTEQTTTATSQPTDSGAVTGSGAGTTTTASTTPTYLGTVSLPTDPLQKADAQPTPAAAVTDETPQPPPDSVAEQTELQEKPAAAEKTPVTAQYVVYKGIIERVRQYRGGKTLAEMTALFDKKIAQMVQQNPPILLSDGKSSATVMINLPARIGTSPNFAVNGGKLVSFSQDKQTKGKWSVEVLPESGSTKVIVTIIAGVEDFDYPLTVAPVAKVALPLNENGWNSFLKEVGGVKTPLHDLNNDGVRDYIDEYIFVANYLVKKEVPVQAPKKK